jgi:hypothetical protein
MVPERPAGDAAAVGSVIHAALERGIRSGERGLIEADVVEIGVYDFSVERAKDILRRAHDIVDGLFARFDIAEVWLEERVWPLEERSDLWGTSDIIGISRCGRTLLVADLKTGRYRIPAKLNVQALIYAAGAIRALGERASALTSIALSIVQPVNGGAGFDVWETDRAMIGDFSLYLAERAILSEALDPVFERGEHCRFCPAKRSCPEFAS